MVVQGDREIIWPLPPISVNVQGRANLTVDEELYKEKERERA